MPRPSLEEIFGKQPMQQQVVQAPAQRPSLAEIFGQPATQIAKPIMQKESKAELEKPLKEYEAKKAQYGISSPLNFLGMAADKLGLGATGQYVDLGLRATADLPIGAAQAVTDLVAPDSLMAEALNKVATDTDRLQAQTPYGGLVRGATQVAQTLPVGGGILSSTVFGGLQPVSGESADVRNMQRLRNAGTGAAFGVVAKGAAPVIEGAINKGSRLVSKGLDKVAGKFGTSELPMDTASRMARAKEMGFDVDNPVYHGTNAPIDKFISSEKGKMGKGVYFTDTPKRSSIYAQGEGGNTVPAYVRGRIADIKQSSEASEMARKELSDSGAFDKLSNSQAMTLWKEKTNDILKKSGFSGRKIDDETLIFDPKDIRSKFAAFNPKDTSANLIDSPTYQNRLGTAADVMRAATPQLPKTGEELKKLTTQAYERAAQTGGQLPANVTDNFINDLESLRPKLIAGKVLPSEGKILNDIIDEYAPLKGSALNFDDVKALDQSFGDKITAALATGNKTVARSLQDVQAKFRGVIDDAAQGLPQLAEARKMAAAQFKMADIENIMKRAEMSDNPATALRIGFKNLYNNAKKSRGYTKQELALIKEAASSSLPAEALRMVGSRLGAIISLGSGGGAAQTAATAVGGAVARKALEGNQMAKGNKVLEAISNRVVPQQSTAIGNISKSVAEATRLAPRAVMPSVTAQPPMVQTPPVTLPNATQPSTMDVVPFEQLMPEAQPNTGTVQPLTPEPLNPSPQSSIEGAIGEAAQIGGASPDLMMAIAETESALNPQARAKTSSATGLFQLTDATWKALVNRYGERHGITTKDITDTRANAIMAGYLTRDNTRRLSNRLGRAITDGEAYIAHFMGVGGAAKLIKGKPDSYAYRLFPTEAKANKSIFFAGNKPRTIAEVKSLLSRKVEDKIEQRKEREQQQQEQERQYALRQQEAMMREREQKALAGLVSKIPPAAIQDLQNNPQLAGDFDNAFGRGASAYFLA